MTEKKGYNEIRLNVACQAAFFVPSEEASLVEQPLRREIRDEEKTQDRERKGLLRKSARAIRDV